MLGLLSHQDSVAVLAAYINGLDKRDVVGGGTWALGREVPVRDRVGAHEKERVVTQSRGKNIGLGLGQFLEANAQVVVSGEQMIDGRIQMQTIRRPFVLSFG